MHTFILLEVASANIDSISELLWERSGVLGIEELPADGAAFFSTDSAHSFAKFDPVAAEQFATWLRSEEFRSGETLLLKVYLDAPLKPWLNQLTQDHPALEIIGQGTLESTDYMATVREQFRGREIGENLWIGPPWQTPPANKTSIIIEPGMAFGLGDHPTTQMCLEILERLAQEDFQPKRIFDIGTGTGILAITAGRLFPQAELWLCDTDPVCATNVAHNFSLNSLPLPTHFHFGKACTLDQIAAPAHGFDLVLSNVYLEALKALAPLVADLLTEKGHWIVSGLLGAEQLEEFKARANILFPGSEVIRSDQWAAWISQEASRLERGPICKSRDDDPASAGK